MKHPNQFSSSEIRHSEVGSAEQVLNIIGNLATRASETPADNFNFLPVSDAKEKHGRVDETIMPNMYGDGTISQMFTHNDSLLGRGSRKKARNLRIDYVGVRPSKRPANNDYLDSFEHPDEHEPTQVDLTAPAGATYRISEGKSEVFVGPGILQGRKLKLFRHDKYKDISLEQSRKSAAKALGGLRSKLGNPRAE